MIRITSKKEDYIRCRVVHPKGERNYPDGTFSEDRLRDLMGDPNLHVEVTDDGIIDGDDQEKKQSKKKSKKSKEV